MAFTDASFKQATVTIPQARVLVTGASGNNGKRIAEYLLKTHAVKVHVGLRDVSKGKDLAALGAEVVPMDWEKKETVGLAFAGVDRLFFVAPMALSWVERCRTAVTTAKAAGVKCIVSISAIGANVDSHAWLAAEHGQCEALVRASGIPYTIQPSSATTSSPSTSKESRRRALSLFGAAKDGRVAYIASDALLLNPACLSWQDPDFDRTTCNHDDRGCRYCQQGGWETGHIHIDVPAAKISGRLSWSIWPS